MWLRPDEFPRSVFPGEVSVELVCLIMESDARIQIFCLPDIKLAVRILQDIYPKDGSPIWTIFATFCGRQQQKCYLHYPSRLDCSSI